MKRRVAFYAAATALLLVAPAAHALTVAEILALKKAGVSEETLQMLIERERDEKIMALRAGTWKLSDGRTVYTTEGLPNPEGEAQPYIPCISPVIDAPLRQPHSDPKKK
ncbi:MAG TPA: hypothetical protein VHL99_01695 [Candidatus Binatia bacterium]|jgi:hypothetical protein|nr:hypothetical protein [Candidatus Binatia bacterium]